MQDQSPASTLSLKQQEVLRALVSGATITAAASKSGVHRSTIHEWCRSHRVFRAALAGARSQQAQLIQEGMRALANEALEELRKLLTSPDTPANTRLRAINAVMAVSSADPLQPPASSKEIDQWIALDDIANGERELRGVLSQTPGNAPCPCGSGQKFKRCCGPRVESPTSRAA